MATKKKTSPKVNLAEMIERSKGTADGFFDRILALDVELVEVPKEKPTRANPPPIPMEARKLTRAQFIAKFKQAPMFDFLVS